MAASDRPTPERLLPSPSGRSSFLPPSPHSVTHIRCYTYTRTVTRCHGVTRHITHVVTVTHIHSHTVAQSGSHSFSHTRGHTHLSHIPTTASCCHGPCQSHALPQSHFLTHPHTHPVSHTFSHTLTPTLVRLQSHAFPYAVTHTVTASQILSHTASYHHTFCHTHTYPVTLSHAHALTHRRTHVHVHTLIGLLSHTYIFSHTCSNTLALSLSHRSPRTHVPWTWADTQDCEPPTGVKYHVTGPFLQRKDPKRSRASQKVPWMQTSVLAEGLIPHQASHH